jgi:hypothetical protein
LIGVSTNLNFDSTPLFPRQVKTEAYSAADLVPAFDRPGNEVVGSAPDPDANPFD